MINQHFCAGELKDAVLFAPARACHEPAMSTCPLHTQENKGEGISKDCCTDQSVFLKSVQADHGLDGKLLLDLPGILPAVLLIPQSLSASSEATPLNPYYRPPQTLLDRAVLYQVFRL